MAVPAPAGDAAPARDAPLQPQLLPASTKVNTPPGEGADGAVGSRGVPSPAHTVSEAPSAPTLPCQSPGCTNVEGMRGAYNKRVRCVRGTCRPASYVRHP